MSLPVRISRENCKLPPLSYRALTFTRGLEGRVYVAVRRFSLRDIYERRLRRGDSDSRDVTPRTTPESVRGLLTPRSGHKQARIETMAATVLRRMALTRTSGPVRTACTGKTRTPLSASVEEGWRKTAASVLRKQFPGSVSGNQRSVR